MNALTWLAIAIVAAFAVGIGLWGIDFWLGGMAVIAAAIAAIGVRNWRRAGREIDQAAIDVAVKRHPAGGKLPGPGQPQASGVGRDEDTGVMTIDDEYRALLDKEGGQR